VTTLLVASTGGHLTQLHELRPRLHGISEDVVWVTFDTAQSRSLLAGEDVIHVAHTGTRDLRHVMSNALIAGDVIRDTGATRVVSTGAAVALSFLPIARALGVRADYIESATRSEGPSLTGRLLSRVPGIGLYTQHPEWANRRWRYGGSVFDGYQSRFKRFPPRTLRRIVVTLGQHDFGFRRLVERLVETLPADAEVLWQTGATDVSALGIEARPSVPADELRAAIGEADVVISHAGIGSILSALDAGCCPVVVPRRPEFAEHVDGHQTEIATALSGSDLAVVREVGELSLDDLMFAASLKVHRAMEPRPFVLGDPVEVGLAPGTSVRPPQPAASRAAI
jgi:UDP-N-acetylglucosamine transferase subunit ALG13